jgi:hypothetical protein
MPLQRHYFAGAPAIHAGLMPDFSRIFWLDQGINDRKLSENAV